MVLVRSYHTKLTAEVGLFSPWQALDCFTAMLSNQGNRQKMAKVIGSKLNISKKKVC